MGDPRVRSLARVTVSAIVNRASVEATLLFFSIGQRAGKVRGKGAQFVLGGRESELVVMGAKETNT